MHRRVVTVRKSEPLAIVGTEPPLAHLQRTPAEAQRSKKMQHEQLSAEWTSMLTEAACYLDAEPAEATAVAPKHHSHALGLLALALLVHRATCAACAAWIGVRAEHKSRAQEESDD